VGGRVAEALAQWAGGRPFWFFARAGQVGVEILSSKTGWAWVGARTRPALSEVLHTAPYRRITSQRNAEGVYSGVVLEC